ncbi:MAG TPA: FAD-dependent oxidoreductase [Candidatus Baltobacteraceae bacterium]
MSARRRDYDMVVIGGGAAGLAAAIVSRTLGARTALIERDRLGGECTFTGCIPSKTLLHIARLFRDAGELRSFTSSPHAAAVNAESVMDRVRSVRERIYQADDSPPNLERRGIVVLRGSARFTAPDEIAVTSDTGDGGRVTFRRAIIASGSEPITLATALPCVTNESLFETSEIPQRFAIAGAGPVGIEMAQAFARLGSAVSVIAPETRILTNDDAESAAVVRDVLEREGVRFYLGRSVADYRLEASRRLVELDDRSRIEADALLAAVGRTSRLGGLGLAAAGVATRDGSIVHDERCRTTSKRIYVSGDAAGWYRFTHAAEHTSRVAATNALLGISMKLDERSMSWATFTQPEIAHAGETQEQLERRGVRFETYRMPYDRIDRAVTDDARAGSIKVLSDPSGRILGASVVGERASDLIAEWALAIKKRLRLRDLSETIHPYPTYALGNKRLADEWSAARVRSKFAWLLRVIYGYRT